MRIIVHGQPAPMGSKRFIGMKNGHGVMVESSKKVKPWREDVKNAAHLARITLAKGGVGLYEMYDAPLVVRMVFSFTRPRSHYRTGRNAHLLKDGAPKQPCGVPDLSKLLRSTEDALTDAGVWRDDSRVVEYERAAKVWCGEDPEGLDSPGAVIVIRRLSDAATDRVCGAIHPETRAVCVMPAHSITVSHIGRGEAWDEDIPF